MINAQKPQEKQRQPGPTPGEVYDGVARIVEQLRAGMNVCEEAGVPFAAGIQLALQCAIIVECQLLDAVIETN